MRSFLMIGVVCIVACACGSDEKSEPGLLVEPAQTAAEQDMDQEWSPAGRSGYTLAMKASLKQGTNSAFGLRIPRGMVPALAPRGVYRFEGLHPVVRVTRYVREQVRARKSVKEPGGGYLFRRAKVIKPADREFAGRLVAIRVFKREGGSYLDIWLEPEHARQESERRASADVSGWSTHKKGTRATRARVSSNASRSLRARSKRNTMRAWTKLKKGQTLTEDDLESDLFH